MSLELRGVRKDYGGVEVLHGVDLVGHPGEVLAVVGANGAGKSTLIRILAGAQSMSAGEMWMDGERVELRSPHDAHARGIRTVYQELTLVPQLSVTENLLMGHFPRKRGGLIDWTAAHARARELLESIGFGAIDPRTVAGRLTVARQQMVEIAKALVDEPRVLVLDEPSAVLAGSDLESLFALIRRLQERGVLVVYVSHRLAEVLELATSIVVIKDGRIVETTEPARTGENELIRLMAGRRLEQIYPDRRAGHGEVRLSVSGLTRGGEFEDVSFSVHSGEIVGLFGLVGSGRSELARCVFGAEPASAGQVRVRSGAESADRSRAGSDAGSADRSRGGSGSEPADRSRGGSGAGSADPERGGSGSGAESVDGERAGSVEREGAGSGVESPSAGRWRGRSGTVGFRTPAEAIAAGLALVTEDRKRTGLVLGMSVLDNITLTTLYSATRGPLIDTGRRRRNVAEMIDRLGIQPSGCASMPVVNLSGGNQQKAVLAKWLLAEPRVLILDEPTRGVDMAARVDIYRMIDDLARQGLAVLLISSDLTEVLGATDRVLVMNQGRITGDLRSDQTTEDEILAHSIGRTA
ncbi:MULTISPECIES: sugar ABC transporter ATP-binding protein [unclassified Streptosporangium]|uniref:sugar ABC transporter ATP-binding protein n=1 Tax=unclassified Streptosporangium TaxID=2632669 RepID=UPI002E2E88B5|nr:MULTISPECIES: ATP-binding cassette domain-containing protein [unclassified Streptosporangium]